MVLGVSFAYELYGSAFLRQDLGSMDHKPNGIELMSHLLGYGCELAWFCPSYTGRVIVTCVTP